jgi:hypothetical protein
MAAVENQKNLDHCTLPPKEAYYTSLKALKL